jgi:predicted alpha/beta hydrolase family esterase
MFRKGPGGYPDGEREFIDIGTADHIIAASGHGEWKQGLEILKRKRFWF